VDNNSTNSSNEMMEDIVEFYKEAAISSEDLFKRKSQEASLLHAFKSNPTSQTFTPLYQSYKPLMIRAASVNMINSPIPKSAHIAYASQSFLDSVRTHDPKKGPFATHMYSTVREKGKRLNYKYQNIGYIPEERITKYGLFNKTIDLMKEELGREPTTHELADEMKWSPKQVETLQREIRKDLILNEDHSESDPFTRSNRATLMFHDLSYNLPKEHALVLEHATGFNGRKALTKPSGGPDIKAISSATGLNSQKIRNALRNITRKTREYRGERFIEEAMPEEAGEE